MSYCPECEAEISGEFEEVGDTVPCPVCGLELEVVSLDPVEFDLALLSDDEEEDDESNFDDGDEDEDWDEDEDDYEDDEDEEDDY